MIVPLLLFVVGMGLSAFFSGSETGFYRVARVRLVLDGLAGDRVASWLLWLTNNPGLFVATTLVGNNLANYLISFSIVLATLHAIAPSEFVELAAPVILSPLVFVYGELLPKNLYYHAPNRLLRRGGRFFLICLFVLGPLSSVLWGLARLLQSVVGTAPLRIKLTLARKELQEVLAEGQEVGILQPAQRKMAQNLFATAAQPVVRIAVPLERLTTARLGTKKSHLLALAGKRSSPMVLVLPAQGKEPLGYVRVIDLYLDPADTLTQYHELVRLAATTSHIDALTQMQTAKGEVALVRDAQGECVGIVHIDALTLPLFRPER